MVSHIKQSKALSSKMVSFVCELVYKTILYVNEAQTIIAKVTSYMQL